MIVIPYSSFVVEQKYSAEVRVLVRPVRRNIQLRPNITRGMFRTSLMDSQLSQAIHQKKRAKLCMLADDVTNNNDKMYINNNILISSSLRLCASGPKNNNKHHHRCRRHNHLSTNFYIRFHRCGDKTPFTR